MGREGTERKKQAVSSPQAIMQVLYDANRAMGAGEICSELTARKQMPGGMRPTQAVRVALSRLVSAKRVKRVDTGSYALDRKKFQAAEQDSDS